MLYRSLGRVNDDGDGAAATASEHIHDDDVTVDQQAFLGKAGVKEFEELPPHEARERLKYVTLKQATCGIKLCIFHMQVSEFKSGYIYVLS